MVREDPVMNARSAPTAPKRVLVADDEHLMATGLAGSLRTLDFEVVGPVASGEEALDIVADEPADLALVDIRMPGSDGLETAHRLWEERGIPSVIISAYADESYLARAQHPGVFGYLLKPVSSDNLRVGIHVAWSRVDEHHKQSQRIGQLESSLGNRRTIEQAKWKLVQVLGITEPDAHVQLQREARDQRRRLIDVANEILADTWTPPSTNA
jgi:AmiR/NasT family two-component response regulator